MAWVMDALYSEAVLSEFHAFEAEYFINEDTGTMYRQTLYE